jgi:hypothetical protein
MGGATQFDPLNTAKFATRLYREGRGIRVWVVLKLLDTL